MGTDNFDDDMVNVNLIDYPHFVLEVLLLITKHDSYNTNLLWSSRVQRLIKDKLNLDVDINGLVGTPIVSLKLSKKDFIWFDIKWHD